MFGDQAWWVLDCIMGKIRLPGHATMDADWRRRQEEEDRPGDDHACIRYQGDYVEELIAETDCPGFSIEAACRAFCEWNKHKKESIMTFRDHGYVSPMTGKKAPPHHTPWKDALDDSLESYLRTGS